MIKSHYSMDAGVRVFLWQFSESALIPTFFWCRIPHPCGVHTKSKGLSHRRDKCERWDSLHYGVDSVEPELSRCPPDTCISSFESHTLPNKKERQKPPLFLGIMCNFNRINRLHPGVHFFLFNDIISLVNSRRNVYVK